MTFEPASQILAFVLPMSFLRCNLTFSKRNGIDDDIHIPVQPTSKSRYVVPTDKLAKGLWRVYLEWSDGRRQYHDEQEISIV
ncbi:FixH family protein [Spirosoma aerolatum]|uniref:FixH family protein n=1 Tax=Spirosoma aerolatum TaxID=1211326 RepID=UPI0009AC4A0A|nr:FixH family protein [Spirosoma aerolatum]